MTTRVIAVSEIMSKLPGTINLLNSAIEDALRMTEKNVSSPLVTDSDFRPVGIVTERDLVSKVCT